MLYAVKTFAVVISNLFTYKYISVRLTLFPTLNMRSKLPISVCLTSAGTYIYIYMYIQEDPGFIILFVDAKTICSAQDDDSNLSFDTLHRYRPSGLQTILNIDLCVSK